MSHPDVLVGFIEEDFVPSGGQASRLNDAVLAQVPETDDLWPPLIRSMLAAPRIDQPLAAFRGRRAISVALHGNFLHESLDHWLPKFENLLRQLYWSRVRLHILTDYLGEYSLRYDWDHAAVAARNSDTPTPPQSWKFRCTAIHEGRFTDELNLGDRTRYSTDPYIRSVPDRVRIQRMLDAATAARDLVRGRTRPDLDSDRVLARVLIRIYDEITIDARQLGEEARRRITDFPWTFIPRPGKFDWFGDWQAPDHPEAVARSDELWAFLKELPWFIDRLERGIVDWPMPSA